MSLSTRSSRSRKWRPNRIDAEDVNSRPVPKSVPKILTPLSQRLRNKVRTNPTSSKSFDGAYPVLETSESSGDPYSSLVDNSKSTPESASRTSAPIIPKEESSHHDVRDSAFSEQKDDSHASPGVMCKVQAADSKMIHPQTSEGHYLVSAGYKVPAPSGLRFSLKDGCGDDMRRTSLHLLETSTGSPSSTLKGSFDFKIFLLLLQPKAKIFELIQVFYDTETATVGDLLNMIPVNATEPALGLQEYVGLCRPKTKEAIYDFKLLASHPDHLNEHKEECAGISRGEILVAIPDGYTSDQIAGLSKYILNNVRINRLLQNSDPLSAPTYRRRHGVEVMEQHAEHANELDGMEDESHSKTLSTLSFRSHTDDPFKLSSSRVSLNSHSLRGSKRSLVRGNCDDDVSVGDCSYTSWSQSFDNSLRRSSRRQVRREKRRVKRNAQTLQIAAAALVLLAMVYLVDPNGFGRNHMAPRSEPMGFFGLVEFATVLIALCSWQRVKSGSTGSSAKPEDLFVFW